MYADTDFTLLVTLIAVTFITGKGDVRIAIAKVIADELGIHTMTSYVRRR